MDTSLGSHLQGQPVLSILMLKWLLPQSSNGRTGFISQTVHMALLPTVLPPLVTRPKLTKSRGQAFINMCVTPLGSVKEPSSGRRGGRCPSLHERQTRLSAGSPLQFPEPELLVWPVYVACRNEDRLRKMV